MDYYYFYFPEYVNKPKCQVRYTLRDNLFEVSQCSMEWEPISAVDVMTRIRNTSFSSLSESEKKNIDPLLDKLESMDYCLFF